MRHFFDGRRLVQAHGAWWLLDDRQLIDRSILSPHGWEPVTTAAVRRLVKPGMVAVDVGANIGWYTVLLAKLGCSVRAYEPMRDAAAVTKAHVELNDIAETVDVRCVALSDTDEQKNGWFNYSWSKDGAEVSQPRESMCFVTLDAGRPLVDFLKVDVDGYEHKFIRGAMTTLRPRPPMILEVCDYTLRQAAGLPLARPAGAPGYGDEVRAMMASLEGLGYRFLREDTFAPIAVGEMLSGWDLSTQSINVVCLPA